MNVRAELVCEEPQRSWTGGHPARLRISHRRSRCCRTCLRFDFSGYTPDVSEPRELADLDDRRPEGVSDDTVSAVGKLSEALESLERARGHLYSFHQMMGHTDLLLGEAVDALRDAGHDGIAERLEDELVGRNVIEGRWTFQIVEDFDDNYWSSFREQEKQARDELQGGIRHVFEAEMKERRRSHGKRHHEATP